MSTRRAVVVLLSIGSLLAKPDLLEEKLRECANNPGELRDTPDCINVNAASARRGMDSMNRGMGPLTKGMGSMNGAGPSEGTQ